MQIDASIFRSYDIRGIVDHALTPEVVQRIAQVIGSKIIEAGKKEVIVARDGRLSSPKLAEKLKQGLMSAGCDVIDIGLAPTPVLYYAVHVSKDHCGIMLTGSHNPADYNGLKTVLCGKSLSEQEIQTIYHRSVKNDVIQGTGSYQQMDITPAYIAAVAEKIQLKKKLKIVIDAGNGISGLLAPSLFERLGCEVVPLFCELDGNFPHHHPDPSQSENLQHLITAVKQHQADIGLAFDGDGDRLGVVTNAGQIIWADRILMLYAQALLATHPGASIIYDVKCTNHLDALIKSKGGVPIMWKTGHSNIKAKLTELQALLAGEMSGHFFFNERWYGFDDGLYAGARVLEIISQSEQSSEEIFDAIPNSVNTPELKISVPDDQKFLVMEQLLANAKFGEAKDVNTIDGVRVNFAEGWGLLLAPG